MRPLLKQRKLIAFVVVVPFSRRIVCSSGQRERESLRIAERGNASLFQFRMKNNNTKKKKKTKTIIADERPRLLETKEKKRRGGNQKSNNSALDIESSLSLSSSSSSSSSQEAVIPLGKDEETYHVYSAVFIKLFSSPYSSYAKTTKTTGRRGGEGFEKFTNREAFLSLAFYGDEEEEEEENEFGGRRSSTSNTLKSVVSLERVSLSGRSNKGGKGGVSVVPCVAAFAAMDEIRFATKSSSSLRFVLTNAENKRVCEGRLNAAGEAAAASIWSRVESEEDEREEEEEEEEKGKKVLSRTEKKAITIEAATRGKRRGESDEETCRLEMSFVGENATVKASCEVPAEKFFAIPRSNERRVSSSSREHSPTPSERGGGAGSEKSVSWHEFNVDRRDDFANSSGDDNVDDDEIDDDDEKNDLKTLLVRGNTTTNSSESSSHINGKEEKIMKPAMMRNKKNSKLVSCLRELIPLEIPSAVASSGNMILRKIDDSKAYAQDTTALIRAQYAELTKEWNHTKAKLNSSGDIISEEEEEEDSIRGTNRALVEMQQMTIVDDGMKSVVSGRAEANASTETHANELSWFSAGVRIGVGVGLGTCLGVGIGVGILVNGMVAGKDKIARIRTVVKSRITGS